MTAQHAAARRPWHEAVRDGLRYLRARLAIRLGCLPLFPATPAPGVAGAGAPARRPAVVEHGAVRAGATPLTPAPGAAPGQATDAAPDVPASGTAQPAPDAPSGPELDTLPLRATPPSSAQGQHPYGDAPLYGIPAIDYPRHDGVIHVSEDGHLTIESRGNWKETRGFPAIVDGPVVPYWYRAWLAAHPEAEVRAA